MGEGSRWAREGSAVHMAAACAMSVGTKEKEARKNASEGKDDPNRRKAQEGREQANLLCHSLGRRCCGVYGAQRAEAHAAELLSHAGRNPSRFSSGGESAEEGGMRLIFSSAAFSAMLRARHKKACALCAVIVRVSNVHRCG